MDLLISHCIRIRAEDLLLIVELRRCEEEYLLREQCLWHVLFIAKKAMLMHPDCAVLPGLADASTLPTRALT